MKKVLLRFGRAVAGAALVVSFLAPQRAAADYFYHLSFEFSGGTAPSGPAPWVDAFFHDVTPGTVDLTISAVGLTGSEFLSGFYINLNPSNSATSLTLTETSTTGSFTLPTIDQGTDAYKADGDGKYDLRFNFSTSGATFGAGDSIIYRITGIAGLTALDFDFLSLPAGGHGPFLAAAHVQGIGPSGADSGWIAPTGLTPVPEPSTALLLSVALGIFGGARRIFARAKKS